MAGIRVPGRLHNARPFSGHPGRPTLHRSPVTRA